MTVQYQLFDAILEPRRRGSWKWKVCLAEGKVIMQGTSPHRPAARYDANKALLLLLLSAPHQSRLNVLTNSSSAGQNRGLSG